MIAKIFSILGPTYQGTEKAKMSALSSLENLQLNYLDLYLIHWPGSAGMKPNNPQNAELRRESWLQLENMYKEGNIVLMCNIICFNLAYMLNTAIKSNKLLHI